MPVPPIPPPLEQLGQRAFSFYPAIVNIEHNEWVFRKATWSEILVANTKTEQELWIPRRYLGAISRVDEPVMIFGLNKELEYKAGQVWPHERRVIEMPRAVNESYRPPGEADTPPIPAPPSGLRMDGGTESRVGLLIGIVLAAGIVGCVAFIMVFRGARDGSRVVYNSVVQSQLGLGPRDDYYAVTRKLGPAAADRWMSDKGEIQYRLLAYPDRGISVVLMGIERGKELYIGALDKEWRVVDSVQLPQGGNTLQMLRNLKRF